MEVSVRAHNKLLVTAQPALSHLNVVSAHAHPIVIELRRVSQGLHTECLQPARQVKSPRMI